MQLLVIFIYIIFNTQGWKEDENPQTFSEAWKSTIHSDITVGDDEQYPEIDRRYRDELDNLILVQLPESLTEEIS